jgi:hypothetical protein
VRGKKAQATVDRAAKARAPTRENMMNREAESIVVGIEERMVHVIRKNKQ